MSGPILDRLDIWLNVHKIDYEKLAERESRGEDSSTVRDRVALARAVQLERYGRFGIQKSFNSEMDAGDIEKIIRMSGNARRLLVGSAEKMGLSGRAFHRVIKVAQTIVDLARKDVIEEIDILEALQYRRKTD
jgi:magnesium chelatase family protein